MPIKTAVMLLIIRLIVSAPTNQTGVMLLIIRIGVSASANQDWGYASHNQNKS